MDSALDLRCSTRARRWVLGGRGPARRGNRHPSIAPYETYRPPTARSRVAVGNDRLFARLCEAVGLPELAGDERFATNSARVEPPRRARARRSRRVFRTQPARRLGRAAARGRRPRRADQRVSEAYALAESLGLEPIARGPTACRARPPAWRARCARRLAAAGRAWRDRASAAWTPVAWLNARGGRDGRRRGRGVFGATALRRVRTAATAPARDSR